MIAKILQILLLFNFAVFFGCATIVNNPIQAMEFDSEPRGAQIWVGGSVVGHTPAKVHVKRQPEQAIEIRKNGYKTYTKNLIAGVSPFAWVSLLTIYGFTTDLVSGHAYEFFPNNYYIILEKESEDVPLSSNRESKVKDFIFSAYDNIIRDINNGKGNYLDSLLALLDVQNKDKSLAIIKLTAISAEYQVIPEFAEKIEQAFQEKKKQAISLDARKAKVKSFILSSYDNIIRDINNGKGNYLDSLIGLLGVKKIDKQLAVIKLIAISAEFQVIPEFAENVNRAFLKN